jgi:hypothetical protein
LVHFRGKFLNLAHDARCILLFKTGCKALGEQGAQPFGLLGGPGDGPGAVEGKSVARPHRFHGLQGPIRRHLFGHALERLVDDRLCRKPSAQRLKEDRLGFENLLLPEAAGIHGLHELNRVFTGNPILNHGPGAIPDRYGHLCQTLLDRIRKDHGGQEQDPSRNQHAAFP